MNTYTKFKILHIVNHIIAIAGIYLAISTQTYFWFFVGLLCFLWTGIVGVNVALHRYYSHQAFKTTKFKLEIKRSIINFNSMRKIKWSICIVVLETDKNYAT